MVAPMHLHICEGSVNPIFLPITTWKSRGSFRGLCMGVFVIGSELLADFVWC